MKFLLALLLTSLFGLSAYGACNPDPRLKLAEKFFTKLAADGEFKGTLRETDYQSGRPIKSKYKGSFAFRKVGETWVLTGEGCRNGECAQYYTDYAYKVGCLVEQGQAVSLTRATGNELAYMAVDGESETGDPGLIVARLKLSRRGQFVYEHKLYSNGKLTFVSEFRGK